MKYALKISKKDLQKLSLSSPVGCKLHMSKLIGQIHTCYSLRSISLNNVVITPNQYIKILKLPVLNFFQLGQKISSTTFITEVSSSKSSLKTLSIRTGSYSHYVQAWYTSNCVPHNLRISLCDSEGIIPYRFTIPQLQHEASLTLHMDKSLIPSHPIAHFKYAPHSNSVELINCDFVSSQCVAMLTRGEIGFSGLTTYHHLQFDNFRQCYIDFHNICCNLTTIYLRYPITASNLELIAVSCPKLRHLNLRGCDQILSPLEGLNSVAHHCSELVALNLVGMEKAAVECKKKLWEILQSMPSLKVLLITDCLIDQSGGPVSMPHLERIYIDHVGSHATFTDGDFDFFTKMTSLKRAQFSNANKVRTFEGLKRLLLALGNLTHLFLYRTKFWNIPTLPVNPLCYSRLEEFCLLIPDFYFRDDLASVLSATCSNLRILNLTVSSISPRSVIMLVEKLDSLSALHINSRDNEFGSRPKTKAFVKSLVSSSRERGRVIEIDINHVMKVDPLHFNWFPGTD